MLGRRRAGKWCGVGATRDNASTSTSTANVAKRPTAPTTTITGIEIDWFITADTMTRRSQRTQCLVRLCFNYGVARIALLANSIGTASMSPAGLAFSEYPDRLRPFVIALICELLNRRLDFEVLNLHCEPLPSSAKWRAIQLAAWKVRIDADVDEGTDDQPDVVTDGGGGEGWIEMTRDAHTRGRWIRLLSSGREGGRRRDPFVSTIVGQRVRSDPERSPIRYLWRVPNGAPPFVMTLFGTGRFDAEAASKYDGRLRDYGVTPLSKGTLLSLRDLEIELKNGGGRARVLPLCDYNVINDNTRLYLDAYSTTTTTTRSTIPTTTNGYGGGRDDDDGNLENVAASTTTTTTTTTTVICGKDESARDRRRFIDKAGNLRSTLYVNFS